MVTTPGGGVQYGCLSCRAKYQIPDERVAAAGVEGLRVRCTRCRAIMVVTTSMARSAPVAPPRSEAQSAQPTTAMTTGVFANPFANVALPTGGDDAGSRAVTGVFIPLLSSVDTAREGTVHFYAAIDGRSRGPYTAKELVMLADKGKVRAGTLVWRPGASAWRPLKNVSEFDVSWLKEAVARRKHREQEAEQSRLERRGIAPIRLERATVGNRLPPPMPTDDWEVRLHDEPSALPRAALGDEASSPFLWRAPSAPSRSRHRRGRTGGRLVAAVVVVAAAAAAASFVL